VKNLPHQKKISMAADTLVGESDDAAEIVETMLYFWQLEFLSHKEQVMFALFCIEQMTSLLAARGENTAALQHITVIIKFWLEEKMIDANIENYRPIRREDFSFDVAFIVSNCLSHSLFMLGNRTLAPDLAAHMAWTACKIAEILKSTTDIRQAQWNYYNELLHFDEIAENILLGVEYEAAQ